jgi:hypothetical protein
MTKVDQLIAKFKEFKEELNKGINASYAPQPNMSMSKDATKQYGKAQNATTGTSGGENSIYKNVVAPMNMTEASPAGIDMMAMSETLKTDKNGQWKIEKSAFKTLQHKIEGQGHSKDSAAAITASIGRKEIGQKEMTARSKAGMNKVDPEENINIPHPQGKAKMSDGVNKEDMKDGTNQRIANPPEKDMQDPRGRVHMVKEEGTNEESNPTKPHNKGKFKVMDEVKEKESKKEKVAGLPYNGDDKKMHKDDKILVGTGTNDENKSPGRNSGHGAL